MCQKDRKAKTLHLPDKRPTVCVADDTVYIQILEVCRPFYFPLSGEHQSTGALSPRLEDSLELASSLHETPRGNKVRQKCRHDHKGKEEARAPH